MQTAKDPVLVTDPDLAARGIIHHCPVTGVYVRADATGTFTVFKPVPSYTHASSDSTYRDKSLAVARCDYLARTMKAKKPC